MGATINCGIGWRTAISMWRWRISPACRPAWSWWISIRNVWCWSSRTRCDWISPAAGRRRMRPPSAPVTCHPWSAARSCWAIRRTSTDASATCCSAEPDSLPWLRAGNLIRDQLRHIRLRLPVERGGVPPRRLRWASPAGAGGGGGVCAPPPPPRAGASAPLTGMIPAGTVGSRLIVVEHGLDVVAVGIMDERGIVARPVVRARTGLAVVGAAGRETRLMERLDGIGGLGAERDV